MVFVGIGYVAVNDPMHGAHSLCRGYSGNSASVKSFQLKGVLVDGVARSSVSLSIVDGRPAGANVCLTCMPLNETLNFVLANRILCVLTLERIQGNSVGSRLPN